MLGGGDDQLAVGHRGVFAGVALSFVVAPAVVAGAEVVGPLGRVEGVAVKFIGPHERPGGAGIPGVGGGGGGQERTGRDERGSGRDKRW